MTLFDKKQPAARVIPSTFGGGWVVPLTPEGHVALAEYFDAEPTEITVLIDSPLGYIVEPQDAADLAEYLKSENLTWSVGE